MSASVMLLYYLCAAPTAPGVQALSCRARQVEAESCEAALAIVEAGIAPDRLYFAAACVATGGTRPRAAGNAPRAGAAQ
jgi:hypothetical protein